MKKALHDLKQIFQPYSVLWEKWSKYQFSGLTEEDIYIIQVHLNNNFLYIEQEVVMFYNSPDTIFQIIQKLKSEYTEFQEWVILKFCINILNLANKQGLHSFLEKPMTLLNLSTELKYCLSNFGFVRLSEFFDAYSDEDFKEPTIFNNMLIFLSIYNKGDKLFLMQA